MSYTSYQFLHVLGTVFLIGNVTVTSAWKLFADRTGDPHVVAFAQRLVTYTDWAFTFWGVVLIVVGGYGMVWTAGIGAFSTPWLIWGQVLFLVSGVIWVAILVPIQWKQARLASEFARTRAIPDEYRRLSRQWIIWGVLATVPLVAAVWKMIDK